MDTGNDRPNRRDIVVPDVWADFYQETHIPAAVRVGNTLRLTGHTGETADGVFSADPLTQIRQTFTNIAITLAEVGATWADVVEINSYRVGLAEQAGLLLDVAAEFLEDPYPAWTDIGVTALFLPEALVEIRCVAVIPSETPPRPTSAPEWA
jgi:enamine deaminase RidA (YjgF/YER057c/UK114 family)